MAHVLVIYASTHGHTARIAARTADVVADTGNEVELIDVAKAPRVDARRYEAVMVLGSIHAERHQRELAKWVSANRSALDAIPTAFVSSSLGLAEQTEEARRAAENLIQDFLERTGWHPGRTLPVAGCLQYPAYGFFIRNLMRLQMRRGGHPTDVSQEHEYTDWPALERYADGFGRELSRDDSVAAGPS